MKTSSFCYDRCHQEEGKRWGRPQQSNNIYKLPDCCGRWDKGEVWSPGGWQGVQVRHHNIGRAAADIHQCQAYGECQQEVGLDLWIYRDREYLHVTSFNNWDWAIVTNPQRCIKSRIVGNFFDVHWQFFFTVLAPCSETQSQGGPSHLCPKGWVL